MVWRQAILALTFSAAFGSGALAHAAPAEGTPSVAACLDASEQGQTLRNDGHLSKARARFAECSSSSCPAPVRASCRKWLADVIESTPTIVVAARDADDRDIEGASVLVDGAPVESVESAKPISLDPGPHVIAVGAPRYARAEDKIIVRLGEKNRLVRVRLEPLAQASPAGPEAPPPPREPAAPEARAKPFPALALGLGGGALAAVAASLVLGLTARSDLADLRDDPCARTRSCSEDATSSLRARFIAADVALGVGVVAAGLAVWAWLSAPRASPSASR